MVGVYASAAAILLASLLLGRALLHLVGRTTATWLSGAVGFAALTVASPLLIRLPGRGGTLAVVLAIAVLASIYYLWRGRERRERTAPGVPLAVIAVVVAAASLPFAFNERDGVLGEGVYTNDQAAQLYWTDWLQHDVGPEPSAVRFGYPTGPQAVAAATAETTGASLLDAFNGLLVAIPVLTALAALAALDELSPGRRALAASMAGLPYLGASFLAQSAFKETAMAMLVLAFAVTLTGVRRGSARAGPHPVRAMAVALIVLAAAGLFVYSLPGLVWFAIAVPIWLALELATGGLRVDLVALRGAVRRHRRALAIVAIALAAVVAFSAAQLSGFVGKVGTVQGSAGRLSSPVFPGEALGVWPEGDFRIVRGEVSGAYPAVALGLLVAAIGAFAAFRRREWGLIAMGVTAVIVYAGARVFASIYVEAKALAVMSPLVVLVALRALLAPPRSAGRSLPGIVTTARYVLGGVALAAFAASTFLALRATPIGFDQRGRELESLAGLVQGRSVVFLGVDRFAAYWLRGTLVRSPGGYVPPEVKARPKKVWQQGLAMDFDTLASRRLDDFDYAITTRSGYQSTAPPNFRVVAKTSSYVLWRRSGVTPPLGVIDVDGTPGRVLDCATPEGRTVARRGGTATVLHRPVRGGPGAWSRGSGFDAPGSATQTLRLARGVWRLSLQYQSQVPLRVSAPGIAGQVELPPSLDGMYLTHHGQGAFWSAGELRANGRGPVTVTVTAARRSGLQGALGVRRQVWLGTLAATRSGSRQLPLRRSCRRYVDHFTLEPGHAGGGPEH
jgi:hypothetical protein